MGLSLALAGMALVFFWAAGVRQRLLGARQSIVQAFVQLDLQMQRRHEALAEVLAATQAAVPLAREALERVAAARLQVMAAAELVRSGPAQAGPIKSLDLAEAGVAMALQGLSGWVAQALAGAPAVPAASTTAPDAQPVADVALEKPQTIASGPEVPVLDVLAPLATAWQSLSQARQGMRFASQACNHSLQAHNEAVQRWPARVVAALMGARGLPLLTVMDHG